MLLGERHSQLFPFCEYVFALGKSPVEVHLLVGDARCLYGLGSTFLIM
jgi:hypothetical protein